MPWPIAYFNRGTLQFAPESAFAMTEGLEIDLWIKPDIAGAQMTLLTGGEIGAERYQLQLIREGNTSAYNVRLRLSLRP